MASSFGVLFALIALVSWGFGDFFIQRSARKFGDWESVLIMSLVGSVLLFPFAIPDLPFLASASFGEFLVLVVAAVSFVVSAFVSVEALRRGKLAVIESVGVVEIPFAGILAFIILHEAVRPLYWFLIVIVLIGIALVTVKPHHFRRETWIERGAMLALLGALVMGTVDFAVGFGARVASPMLTIWFANLVTAAVACVYMGDTGRFRHFVRDCRSHARLMVGIGVLDNAAWLAFALATSFVPIVVALVLSESYVILATILGMTVNGEKLRPVQLAGIGIALAGVMILAQFY